MVHSGVLYIFCATVKCPNVAGPGVAYLEPPLPHPLNGPDHGL